MYLKTMRLSFARLLIEVDVTKSLPKSVTLQDPTWKTISQRVEYDWLPPFFQKCNVVRHKCGTSQQNTTRMKPICVQQKKVLKVWQPKQAVHAIVVEPSVLVESSDDIAEVNIVH